MNSPWCLGIFAIGAVYFGVLLLRVLPTLVRLLVSLRTGAVRWPGPIVYDRDPSVSSGRARLGWPEEHLFPTLLWHASVVTAACAFSIFALIGFSRSLVALRESKAWFEAIAILIAYAGGLLSARRVLRHRNQVQQLLSDLTRGVEPRQVDRSSAEAEYAIEHPLVRHPPQRPETKKALRLYLEGLTRLHAGDRARGNLLNQEALSADPALHEHARESLSGMARECSSPEVGPIYYWLGIHSENLRDFHQAAAWYEKAADAFQQLGFGKREGRAHCNLGTVQLQLGNRQRGMEEFEKAVALNPSDGIAHFNIGMLYYMSRDPEDPEYARALDAFAAAIAADPETYGPLVASRLRAYAYTWQEDLREVMQRVSNKRQ
jgi:tetratricopeptide (TPR) repeat protein